MTLLYKQALFRLLFVLAIIVCLFLTLYTAFVTAYPFIIGFVIAFTINPIVNFLQEKGKFSRWLAVIVVLACFIALAVACIVFIISEIIMGTTYLSQAVPANFQLLILKCQQLFAEKIIPLYEQLSHFFYSLERDHQATILSYSETFTSQLTTAVSSTIQTVLSGSSELLLALPNLASALIFSLLAAFFISKDWYKLAFLFRKWLPKGVAIRTKAVINHLRKAFLGFILAQLTLISITFSIVLVGLLFLNVNYPLTIALIIALVDLLPYLGIGLIFLPWILFSFFSGQHALAIGLGVLYIIVMLQRQISEPKLVSSSIGVNPLASLASLFIGYKLFGFLGLFLGPIILVFIQTLFKANVFHDLRDYIISENKNKQ